MTRYKPGSRIARVWAALQESGPEAATNLGTGLGLAAGTLRSWLRAWEREASGEGRAKPGKGKAGAEAEAAQTPPRGNIKVSWSDRPARLIEEGPEQSMIKWLDTGSTQAIVNGQWTRINKD